jgi:hypothetical protein
MRGDSQASISFLETRDKIVYETEENFIKEAV